MGNPTTDERKVFVTLESLGVLAKTALRNGTEPAFMTIALKWAEGANAEIERLVLERLQAQHERDAVLECVVMVPSPSAICALLGCKNREEHLHGVLESSDAVDVGGGT